MDPLGLEDCLYSVCVTDTSDGIVVDPGILWAMNYSSGDVSALPSKAVAVAAGKKKFFDRSKVVGYSTAWDALTLDCAKALGFSSVAEAQSRLRNTNIKFTN